MPQTGGETSNASGPVGQGDYEVQDGDCMESIALAHGHFWEKLWNLGENSEVKEARKDPNVLLRGDRLTIPEIVVKEESGATDAKHKFRRKGVPSIFKVQCLYLDEPLANMPYVLDVDGKQFTGNTDKDGKLERPIPPDAKAAKLAVGTKPDQFEYNFNLGSMNPIDTISGMKQRLNNLGFAAGPEDDELTDQFERALLKFQKQYKLEETGDPDQPTKDKLKSFGV
jgi:hypothetical protein